MKKYILTLLTVVAIVLLGRKLSEPPGDLSAVNSFTNSAQAPQTQPASAWKDGTYTGEAVDAYYGIIQVQPIVSGGKITKVNILSYPNDNPVSQSINNQAIPILQSEAIQNQTAHVDAVSGASFTSQAFLSSLSSAMNQAN